MAVKITRELITPEKAQHFLGMSRKNRPLKQKIVTSYSEIIKRGSWKDFPAIVFDADGRFIDGQHRMHAIIEANTPVWLHAVHGVENSTFDVIDGGTKRSLSVRMSLRDSNLSHITDRSAAVTMCAYLLTGSTIPINSPEEFYSWQAVFKPGIDWAINTFGSSKVMRISPVIGGLAFAYKTNPEVIELFGQGLESGVGLNKKDPELTLRDHLMHRQAGGGTSRIPVVRGVLNAAMAKVQKRTLSRIRDTDIGREFFLEAYKKSKAAQELKKPWVSEDK